MKGDVEKEQEDDRQKYWTTSVQEVEEEGKEGTGTEADITALAGTERIRSFIMEDFRFLCCCCLHGGP